MKDIYFGGIEVVVGSKLQIDELAASDSDKMHLRDNGFDTFSVLDEPLDSLLINCINGTLLASKSSAGDVDTIIVTSNSALTNDSYESVLQMALKEVGFCDQPVIGVNYSLCANFSSALNLASLLIETSKAHNILVVNVDVFGRKHNRIGNNLMYVMSDCISSCLVSAYPKEFKVHGISIMGLYDHLINKPQESESNVLSKIEKMHRIVSFLMSNFPASCDISSPYFDHFVLENFSDNVTMFLCKLLTIDSDKLFSAGKKDYGHLAASDLLYALKQMRIGKNVLQNEATIGHMTMSRTTAALVALSYCEEAF